MSNQLQLGYTEGDICNRAGCIGIIAERPAENCTCHISPPCSACTTARGYCLECGWVAEDDMPINDHIVNVDPATGNWRTWTLRELDSSKIDWRSKSHTHSTMIKEGVYPEGVSLADVEARVRGTFGGHFEYFRDGRFKYIAYTD